MTLAPGAYHISGLSMVAYFTKDDPPETIVARSPASAGYCRLRSFNSGAGVDPATLRELPNSDPRIICIGSPSTANLCPACSKPTSKPTSRWQTLVEHQSGSQPEQIYLRVFTQNSKWHAFARISIRRILNKARASASSLER